MLQTQSAVVRRKFKRLRRAGGKPTPQKTPVKRAPVKKITAKRRVALVPAKRPKRATLKPAKRPKKAFGTGMPAFTGLKTYHSALGAIESKYGGAADLAPDLGFSI
jgi:hypothetical protein